VIGKTLGNETRQLLQGAYKFVESELRKRLPGLYFSAALACPECHNGDNGEFEWSEVANETVVDCETCFKSVHIVPANCESPSQNVERTIEPKDILNAIHASSLPPPKEVEDLISRATHAMSSSEDAETLLPKMQEVEMPIAKWLASLAKREVEDDDEPTEEDIIWIRRVAKFYHALVPLMRIVLEAKFKHKRSPITVFVSHTGTSKESYAAPLANYLSENGVVGVFLDKDLLVGAKGDDEMMWAAVSCKYFWCVLTKDFVQKEYPIRELMVGYIRHIQESGEKFSLLLDCVEM
jgi:hypothetical protein